MISTLLKKLPLVALAAVCAAPVIVRAETEIGDVTSSTKRGRPVIVTGDDPVLVGWARKAIGAHGDFDTSGGKASLTLTFTKAGPNAVSVTASGSENWTIPAQQGATIMDALWRAVDAAIVTAGKARNVKPLFAVTKLAFIRDTSKSASEVYVGDLMLTTIAGLTGHGKISRSPHWSPDGASVYYTSWFGSGGADVYRVNRSGGVNKIASYKGTNTGGAVSPDGSRIALALSPKGTSDIYVAAPDGFGPKAIVATSDVEMSPCWSPDGSRIAYTGGVSGRPQIMVVGANGGASRRVSTGGYSSEPAWNPVKTNRIAFTIGDHAGIGVADLDTGGVSRLKERSPVPVSHPTWCADGRHMVVAVGKDGRYRLGLYDSESGKLTIISGSNYGSCSDPDALVSR